MLMYQVFIQNWLKKGQLSNVLLTKLIYVTNRNIHCISIDFTTTMMFIYCVSYSQ